MLFAEPKGTLLPLGGLDAGHKGYALALLVEMATGGLAGFGRADPTEGWGATEAPRGALMHQCTITAGKITKYQCIVPTTWNGSPQC